MGRTKLLVAALVFLGVAGATNYHRNVSREAQQLRPFRGYADADLDTMLEAYRTDADSLSGRYVATQQGRTALRGGGLIDQQIDQFERIQQRREVIREAGAQLSMREADIQQIEKEKKLRAAERNRFMLILRRLTTFE
jgi:hypothetical protein